MFGDCHIHMVLNGVLGYREAMDRFSGGANDDVIRSTLRQYQKAGVTYLRDGGDKYGAAKRAAELAGEFGITYRTPIVPLCEEGRYGSFIGCTFSGMDDFRTRVADLKSQGAHFLKIMLSGLVDFNEYGVLSCEPVESDRIREMIDIGHEAGLAVMAHCNGDEPCRAAIEAGVDSLEHGYYMEQETLRILSESDTVWVPTIVTVGNLLNDDRYPREVTRRIFDEQLWKIGTAAGWGANIALGSDAGAYLVPHVQGLVDEYEYLKEELGENTDSILQTGEDMIRWKFGGLE